jgi:hypothetical protein
MRVVEVDEPAFSASGLLTEDQVKFAVKGVLEQRGFSVAVAWGHIRGVDLEATNDRQRLLIEAKGDAATPQQQGAYFLGALGELVQRMIDPDAEYGLAFPDNRRYRGLVERLPDLAVESLRLHVFYVSREQDQWLVRWNSWNDSHLDYE